MNSDSAYLSIVHQHAERDAQAVAFEISAADRSTVLTYGGVVERVQRLGEALRRAGFRDGACIAICMENRPAWPVSYLAAWYAGAVTVPLDPALDEDVLARLLAHSGAVACVTSAELSTKLRAACATMTKPPLLLSPEPQGDEPLQFASWDGDARGASGAARHSANDDHVGELARGNAAAGGDEPAPVPDLELLVSLDAFVDQHGSMTPDWRPAVADDETLGSLMYTSGTTGDPKGVMIRQNAVLENLRAGVARVSFAPNDRILGVLPLFHVLPLITNCLGPLYLGARVVFLYELTAEAIMAAFRRHDITVFVCVPAFFYRFHDRLTSTIGAAPTPRRQLAALMIAISRFGRRRWGRAWGRRLLGKAHAPFGRKMRLFITGGAKINGQVYDDFLDWGFCLAQGYGLTEATAIITASPLDELRGDTVGKPIEGVEVKIHEPAADGIGEVWARGPSIMSGYYRNEEATAAALADGWLRTGDLGRLLDNGHLQITGRAKDVIVLASGKNIYPDELEGHYGQSELIDEMCIVGLPDDSGRGERLHGVIVLDMDAARRRGYVNVREMVMWDLEGLGAKLPGPQRLTSMELRSEPLPRTPTRKIKRYVLMQELAERDPEEDVEDPPVEAVVAETADLPEWAPEVMAVIGRYAKSRSIVPEAHLDLDLGLESLDRMEMLAELQQARGVRLDDDIAGRVHTVAELLRALQEAQQSGEAGGTAAPAGGVGWERLLSVTPPGIDRSLRRRPLLELGMFGALRSVRLAWRLLAGFRSDGTERLPHTGPFMLCANHTSYLDPFVLCMALPRGALRQVFFVGYSEYFEGTVGGAVGRLLRNIPIDPNRNLEHAMQASAAGLRRGMILVIFPEGARSIDGTVREFRRGAATLSRHLDVPIVPVGIWGAHQAWPRQGAVQRHAIGVQFGEPIAGSWASDAELRDALRGEVEALVEEARRRLCPDPSAV